MRAEEKPYSLASIVNSKAAEKPRKKLAKKTTANR